MVLVTDKRNVFPCGLVPIFCLVKKSNCTPGRVENKLPNICDQKLEVEIGCIKTTG